MHEFAPVDANVALNQTHACVMFAPPTVSENWNANVCEAPVPELGEAEIAVTTPGMVAVTVSKSVLVFPAASAAVTVIALLPD